ncbi:MAG: biotin/lipoyl-binding protein [Anaerolineae bacterium]|jgi:acetyl/propionyl-CoA carboxylase alpha subunit|nr:biotin/lipoyl-binding protein [Anaerolineae bacterium]
MYTLHITVDGQSFTVEAPPMLPGDTRLTLHVNGTPVEITLPDALEPDRLLVNERPYEIDYDRDLHWLKIFGRLHALDIKDQQAAGGGQRSGDGRVKAPIPGRITRILVQPGEAVEAGQTVIMLEAMKMENQLRATRAGIVRSIQVAAGQTVVRSQVLLEVE